MLTRGALFFTIAFALLLLSGCASTEGPVTTTLFVITSQPPGADIYWGPSKTEFENTGYRTPYGERNTCYLPTWKPRYYQVRKKGYHNSAVIFRPQAQGTRRVNLTLIPVKEDKS